MSPKVLKGLRSASRVLIAVAVVGLIPLTMEVFGDMRPEWISIWAVVTGIGLFGSNACTILWGIESWRQQKRKQK